MIGKESGSATSLDHSVSRRRFLSSLGVAAGVAMLPLPLRGATGPGGARRAFRVGIIGSGELGGALGLKWAEAGHQVLFSSRNPDTLGDLVAQAGAGARAGFPNEAAEFGEVVFIAVPYGALPQVGRDFSPLMRGKAVIECGNPQDTDGAMYLEALEKGTGVASAEFLPGVRLVRAFNAIAAFQIRRGSVNAAGERIGLPIAGDDQEAVEMAVQLGRDAGFEPVVVGPLSRAREFDIGTPVWVRGMTAPQLRAALGLPAT